MPQRMLQPILALAALVLFATGSVAHAHSDNLPDVIERVTPSIVVVGTHAPLRQPSGDFRGTGFAVADGRHVLTNAHVIPRRLGADDNERLAVFTRAGGDGDVEPREAEIVAEDSDHDTALLRISGDPLPALTLGDSDRVRPGERYTFTGFPIGMVLGMYPATHEAMISAVTPIAIPQGRAGQLDPATIRRLSAPYDVFQLDGTAYPGNSGSPLYDPDDGTVIGILNMVFVKGTKERVIQDPSGIAYAIPIRHARELIAEALGD